MTENEQPTEYQTEYQDEESNSGIFRWMSTLVVVAAIAGFLGLAWYAYKSGGDNIDEKDVELIKADTTPVKEAPANPGGMEIPHQDKTVYGLINGEHTDKPTVERVLPNPEEPVAHGNDTETWMSDKAKNKAAAAAPDSKPADAGTSEAIAAAVVGDANAPSPATPVAPQSPKAQQFDPAKAAANTDTTAKPATAAAPESIAIAPAPVVKNAATPAAHSKEVAENDSNDTNEDVNEKTPPAPPAQNPSQKAASAQTQQEKAVTAPVNVPAPTPALPKGTRVQLAAYKSEKEANEDWLRIAKEFPDELGKHQHFVVRAELSKGTFYRLQVGPFTSKEEGEQFCLGLVSAGQGCLIARDK